MTILKLHLISTCRLSISQSISLAYWNILNFFLLGVHNNYSLHLPSNPLPVWFSYCIIGQTFVYVQCKKAFMKSVPHQFSVFYLHQCNNKNLFFLIHSNNLYCKQFQTSLYFSLIILVEFQLEKKSFYLIIFNQYILRIFQVWKSSKDMQKLAKGVYCQMAICFSCLKGWSQDKNIPIHSVFLYCIEWIYIHILIYMYEYIKIQGHLNAITVLPTY